MSVHPLPSKIQYDIPTLTATGTKIGKLSPEIHQGLRQFYRLRKAMTQVESVPDYIKTATSEIVPITPQIKTQLHDYFLPICRGWIEDQYALNPTYVYGIRTYLRGAWLKQHRDRQETHHVSAIIQIDQEVDKDWVLHMENNDGQWDEIILKPGEFVLYESARLEHGRLDEFQGNAYRNCFVHYGLGDKR
jgi:prolyl 4-hydroxylase